MSHKFGLIILSANKFWNRKKTCEICRLDMVGAGSTPWYPVLNGKVKYQGDINIPTCNQIIMKKALE